MDTRSPAIEAVGLSLRTRRGAVYENVTVAVPVGALAMLVGPTGSGKTALLLTLAGRMKPTRGLLRSFGEDGLRLGSAVRRRTSLALIGGVNDLADTLTVEDHVREALTLHGERATAARITAALSAVGLTAAPGRKVASLPAIERELLGIALALVYGPRVLVVDDADHDLTPDEQQRLMHALRSIADSGITVVAACVDPRLAADADVTLVVTLDAANGGGLNEVA
jgi:ABC-type multidrug transport system ATPase subunit